MRGLSTATFSGDGVGDSKDLFRFFEFLFLKVSP